MAISKKNYFPNRISLKSGTEHNRLLIGIIDRIQAKAGAHQSVKSNASGITVNSENQTINLFTETNSFLTTIGYPAIGQAQFDNYMQIFTPSVIDLTIADSISAIENADARTIMSNLILGIGTAGDYSSLTYQIASLTQEAETNLTGVDRDAVLAALSVASNSASMWLAVSDGGQGYYDIVGDQLYPLLNPASKRATEFSSVRNNSVNSRQVNFMKEKKKAISSIIGADVIGAFTGFMQAIRPYILLGGAANPIANSALLTAAIIGGVGGSASAAFQRALQ